MLGIGQVWLILRHNRTPKEIASNPKTDTHGSNESNLPDSICIQMIESSLKDAEKKLNRNYDSQTAAQIPPKRGGSPMNRTQCQNQENQDEQQIFKQSCG
jgi:hypothetical protein